MDDVRTSGYTQSKIFPACHGMEASNGTMTEAGAGGAKAEEAERAGAAADSTSAHTPKMDTSPAPASAQSESEQRDDAYKQQTPTRSKCEGEQNSQAKGNAEGGMQAKNRAQEASHAASSRSTQPETMASAAHPASPSLVVPAVLSWVACDKCEKWRRLNEGSLAQYQDKAFHCTYLPGFDCSTPEGDSNLMLYISLTILPCIHV